MTLAFASTASTTSLRLHEVLRIYLATVSLVEKFTRNQHDLELIRNAYHSTPQWVRSHK